MSEYSEETQKQLEQVMFVKVLPDSDTFIYGKTGMGKDKGVLQILGLQVLQIRKKMAEFIFQSIWKKQLIKMCLAQKQKKSQLI